MRADVIQRRRFLFELCLCSFLALAIWPIAPGYTEELTVGGHTKYQLDLLDTGRPGVIGSTEHPAGHELDARGKFEWAGQDSEFSAHPELLGAGGDIAKGFKATPLAAFLGSESLEDSRRLFDLSQEISDSEDFRLISRLDRLYAAYRDDESIVRAGRQALSWGNGIVFSALDVFSPFSPTEIDKDYKSGDDMLFAQHSLADYGDIQALLIPRRDPADHKLQSNQSSLAAKYHQRVPEADIDLDFVAGRHYDETLLGFGVSADIYEAVARLDISYSLAGEESDALFLTANIDRSWELFGKNFYGFIEYFYSGVGYDEVDFTDRHTALFDRLSRGELFTLGRNYLANGVRMEASALVNLFLNNILNLDDTSGFLQFRCEYSVYQDVLIMAGTDLPYGGSQSEFGTLEIPGLASVERPRQAYFRIGYYF